MCSSDLFSDILDEAAEVAGSDGRIIVKIDAEGAEYDLIMRTGQEHLARIDELFVETHAYAEGSTDDLVGRLENAGLPCIDRESLADGAYEVLHLQRSGHRND